MIQDELFDPTDRPETHRAHRADWRQRDHYFRGAHRSELEYVGPTAGCYVASSIVENGYEEGEVVYVVHAPDSGRLKIGRTNDVRKRLSQLQSSSPVRLYLAATFLPDSGHSEGSLHEQFGLHRIHGEWFSDDILDDLLALALA